MQKGNVQHTTGQILDSIAERKFAFLVVFAFFFILGGTFLLSLGDASQAGISVSSTHTSERAAITLGETSDDIVQPERVVIEKISVDATIVNPQSRDIEVLDEALNGGVVHFPGSGGLNEDTNMFLFGHSSYLPIVRNANYKVFNGLQKLEPGDMVRVYGEGREYLYKVSSVRLDEAAAIRVPLVRGTKMLTLSTCNSFGSEGERFVVEAEFVGSYPVLIS